MISNLAQFFNFLNINTNSLNVSQTDSFIKFGVPLGISFIAFQAIGYIVDIHSGKIKCEKNIGFFATFIFFFPKVISGPIERPQDFLPQLLEKHEFNYQQTIEGFKRIVWGLFKKLVIANRLAIYTDAVFNNYEYHSAITLLFAAVQD